MQKAKGPLQPGCISLPGIVLSCSFPEKIRGSFSCIGHYFLSKKTSVSPGGIHLCHPTILYPCDPPHIQDSQKSSIHPIKLHKSGPDFGPVFEGVGQVYLHFYGPGPDVNTKKSRGHKYKSPLFVHYENTPPDPPSNACRCR